MDLIGGDLVVVEDGFDVVEQRRRAAEEPLRAVQAGVAQVVAELIGVEAGGDDFLVLGGGRAAVPRFGS